MITPNRAMSSNRYDSRALLRPPKHTEQFTLLSFQPSQNRWFQLGNAWAAPTRQQELAWSIHHIIKTTACQLQTYGEVSCKSFSPRCSHSSRPRSVFLRHGSMPLMQQRCATQLESIGMIPSTCLTRFGEPDARISSHLSDTGRRRGRSKML